MNGGQRPRVTRIQKLQKIEGFTAANLTEQYSVRAVTKSGFEQVADRYAGKAVLRVACFKPDEVRLGDLNFRGVLNQENPLFLGYESAEDIQGRGLSGAGAATNQNVLAGKDVVFESIGEWLVECSGCDQVLHFKVARVELADGQGDAAQDCTAE